MYYTTEPKDRLPQSRTGLVHKPIDLEPLRLTSPDQRFVRYQQVRLTSQGIVSPRELYLEAVYGIVHVGIDARMISFCGRWEPAARHLL